MDTTIRNLDEDAYRAIKAHAALRGKTVGEAVSEAIRAYVAATPPFPKSGSLKDIVPEHWGPGTEHTSEEIDEIVYGI
ncbi:MAG TPA: ribbon-helix-helix domain-containing protein [Candidatus Thermoplasmatota archaeon]|nr:ribbon-helix-helix domain-containing protein [Candidatus Thermoplasmatota archaeon]